MTLQEASDGGPTRILVVDDVPDNVEILDARLSSRGYAIVTAATGEEALDRVTVQLAAPGAGPGLDAEVLRRLRERLGGAVHLRVERVDRIPRGARGKLRLVESRVRHLYPRAAPTPAGAPSTADEAWD